MQYLECTTSASGRFWSTWLSSLLSHVMR